MAGPLHASSSRLHVRRCLRCGYDGTLLKRGRAARCARCGCDLRRRPARSYAEMEGFVTTATSPAQRLRSEQRTIERWLVALFAAVVAIVAAATLLAGHVP